MKLPDVYSGDLSEFVFAAGVKLIPEFKPDLVYLSTTDFIQHKYGPTEQGALEFYAMFDSYVGKLDALGVTLIITADHGMNDKHLANGEPDVLYLQDVLDDKFGAGQTKVILPITDPYVVHHGALGSYAAIYTFGAEPVAVARFVKSLDGIDAVLEKSDACQRFGLPPDRTAEVIAVSGGPTKTKVLGTSRAKHDLSGLDVPLRSHGGLTEQRVPFFINKPYHDLPQGLRNFDAFYVGCNFAE